MKPIILLLCALFSFNMELYGQTIYPGKDQSVWPNIVDSVKYLPLHKNTSNNIKLIVYYNEVTGRYKPSDAEIDMVDHTINIKTRLGVGNPNGFSNYIDTIELGKLDKRKHQTVLHIRDRELIYGGLVFHNFKVYEEMPNLNYYRLELTPKKPYNNDSVQLHIDWDTTFIPCSRDSSKVTVTDSVIEVFQYVTADSLPGNCNTSARNITIDLGKLNPGNYRLKYHYNLVDSLVSINDSLDFRVLSTQIKIEDHLQASNRAMLYPNPVTSRLFIKAKQMIEFITIYNNLGQLKKHIYVGDTKATINMASYRRGLYIIKIQYKDQCSYHRIIKQ